MAVHELIPTEDEVAAAIERYVRVWLLGLVHLDAEAQVLTLASLRDLECGCSFHEAMLDQLAEFGERLKRVRPPEDA